MGDRPSTFTPALHSTTIKVLTACGRMYVTIVRDDEGGVATLFTNIGKAGRCPAALAETVCRLATRSLERGDTIDGVHKSLVGMQCGKDPLVTDGRTITSCQDAIAYAIEIERDLHATRERIEE